MSEPFNQLSLTRRSDAYWRVTFSHPPINLLDLVLIIELDTSKCDCLRHHAEDVTGMKRLGDHVSVHAAEDAHEPEHAWHCIAHVVERLHSDLIVGERSLPGLQRHLDRDRFLARAERVAFEDVEHCRAFDEGAIGGARGLQDRGRGHAD